jgi:hypothetical protein
VADIVIERYLQAAGAPARTAPDGRRAVAGTRGR